MGQHKDTGRHLQANYCAVKECHYKPKVKWCDLFQVELKRKWFTYKGKKRIKLIPWHFELYSNCLERALALVLLWSEPGLSQRDYLYLSWVGQSRFPLFKKPVFQINEGKIQKRFPLCDTSTRKRRCFQNVNINRFQGVTFLMGKVVIWRETILCANFETKSEKQKKKITRCATFYREMWKLKALKGSSCGVGCYRSHITVKPTARLFVEMSNYVKRQYFNCRSLMTGMKHAIHLMKRILTSDKRAKIDEVIRYCFAIVLSS